MKFITPVDVTHAEDATWTDVDITSHVGSDAGSVAVAVIQIRNKGASGTLDWGAQTTNSTDDFTGELPQGEHAQYGVGVDGNDVFELYLEDASEFEVWLLGYATSAEAEFDDNLTDVSPTTEDSWQDVDVSSVTGVDPAQVVFLLARRTRNFGSHALAVQPGGSTDDELAPEMEVEQQIGMAINVDANEVFECYNESDSFNEVRVSAWLTDNVPTKNTNGSTYTPTTGSWQTTGIDADVSPDDVGALFKVQKGNALVVQQSFRGVGDSAPLSDDAKQVYGWCRIDANEDVDLYLEDTGITFFLYATTEEPAGGGGTTVSGGVSSQPATTQGEIDLSIDAAGDVQAEASSSQGSVAVDLDAQGDVQAEDATTQASLSVVATVDGAVSAQASSADGSVNSEADVQGAVQAQDASAQGAVDLEVSVQGAVQPGDATAAGECAMVLTTSGAVQAADSTSDGEVTGPAVDRTVEGDVQAQNSTAQGDVGVEASVQGSVSAQDSTTDCSLGPVASVSGDVQAADAAVDGSASLQAVVSGDVSAQEASVGGSIDAIAGVSGIVAANDASVGGSVDVSLSVQGAVVAQDAVAAGNAEVVLGVSGAVQAGAAATAGIVREPGSVIRPSAPFRATPALYPAPYPYGPTKSKGS